MEQCDFAYMGLLDIALSWGLKPILSIRGNSNFKEIKSIPELLNNVTLQYMELLDTVL